jgi:hypothetical protein
MEVNDMINNEDKMVELEEWFESKLSKDKMVFLSDVKDKVYELYDIPPFAHVDLSYIIERLNKINKKLETQR